MTKAGSFLLVQSLPGLNKQKKEEKKNSVICRGFKELIDHKVMYNNVITKNEKAKIPLKTHPVY